MRGHKNRTGLRISSWPAAAFVAAVACLMPWMAALLSPTIAPAQDDLLGGLKLNKKSGADPVQIEATLTRENPTAPAILAVTVRLPREHYILSTTDPSAVRTKIKVDAPAGLEAIDDAFIPDRDPKTQFEKVLKVDQEKFYESVTWFRRYRVAEGIEPESVVVTGELTGQYCGPNECVPIRPARKFEAQLTTAVPLHRLPAALTGAPPATSRNGESTNADAAKPKEGETTASRSKLPATLTERPRIAGKPGPAELTFSLTPENAAAGETVRLSILMKLDGDYHTYSMTMAEGQAAIPTKLLLEAPQGLRPLTAIKAVQEPELKTIKLEKEALHQEVHHGEVEWTQDFVVTEEGASDGYGLWGKLQYQTCTGSNCLPPKPFKFALGAVPKAAIHMAQAAKPGDGRKVEVGHPVADAQAPGQGPAMNDVAGAASGIPGADQGLWAFLAAAVVAGFAALLTPCVFPMVPITVSFFLKQTESKHHRPLVMALLYCGGIIGTFTILGLLMAAAYGGGSINKLATQPWLNLVLGGVMVFFALNLLGMFEIRVPYWLLTWTSGHEGKGGALGVLFMALTFTLVSFTCTFAFCGLLLAWAAKGNYYWPILGMLAFSAAFSSPFFLLALFPSLLKKLPKSGGWMNTVKVTMGMLELGAAIKFFSVADRPPQALFDYTMTILGWMVVAFATGGYLLGLYRFPHDTKSDSISVGRFGFALGFLTLGAFLAVGLFAQREPDGTAWQYVKSFAPGRLNVTEDVDLGPAADVHGLKFALDFERAMQIARQTNRPLFFDFTGYFCTNCRLMEDRMSQPENRKLLDRFVRAQIYTDLVPGLSDKNEAERLLEMNQKYQEDVYGDVTLPAYAVLTPDGQFLARYVGLEKNAGEFTRFLNEGLERWSKVAGVPAQKELSRDDRLGPTIDFHGIDFALDFDRAKRFADQRGKPVLAYTIGMGSPNLRLMDSVLAGTLAESARRGRFVPASLFADEVPGINDEHEAARLIEINQKFQVDALGDVTTPALAVLASDGAVVSKYVGMERERGDYGRFLDDAWTRWLTQQRLTR